MWIVSHSLWILSNNDMLFSFRSHLNGHYNHLIVDLCICATDIIDISTYLNYYTDYMNLELVSLDYAQKNRISDNFFRHDFNLPKVQSPPSTRGSGESNDLNCTHENCAGQIRKSPMLTIAQK